MSIGGIWHLSGHAPFFSWPAGLAARCDGYAGASRQPRAGTEPAREASGGLPGNPVGLPETLGGSPGCLAAPACGDLCPAAKLQPFASPLAWLGGRPCAPEGRSPPPPHWWGFGDNGHSEPPGPRPSNTRASFQAPIPATLGAGTRRPVASKNAVIVTRPRGCGDKLRLPQSTVNLNAAAPVCAVSDPPGLTPFLRHRCCAMVSDPEGQTPAVGRNKATAALRRSALDTWNG